jgi:hypothetical protein
MWIRVLRVVSLNKTLGTLVIIFRRMLKDALSFLVLLVILLVSFMILIDAGLPAPQEDPEAVGGTANQWQSCTEAEANDDHGIVARCSTLSWSFLRTFFQALGDPMLDDMSGAQGVELWPAVVVALLFFIVNVIALNLLIAFMSSSYNTVQEQAKKRWMQEQVSWLCLQSVVRA